MERQGESREPLADASPPLTPYQESFATLVARLIGMAHEIERLPGCSASVALGESAERELGLITITFRLPPPAAASDGR